VAGNFFHQVEHVQHRRAFADDSMKLVVFEEFMFELADFGPAREDFGNIVERFFQTAEIERLV
jgi:hypothetical protein